MREVFRQYVVANDVVAGGYKKIQYDKIGF